MSTKKSKYHTFAVGWLKEGKNGQYVSAVANGPRSKMKLFLQMEDGSTLPLDKFAVFFNAPTEEETDKSTKARFVFTER